MGGLAEFPDLVRNMFVNTDTNSEGIYNVRFYIRGKPWVVTVDDYMLFQYPSSLVFAQPNKDASVIWGAVLEKAWAKVKGNYLIAEGGMVTNGLRALTGFPVFDHSTSALLSSDGSLDAMFTQVQEAEAN